MHSFHVQPLSLTNCTKGSSKRHTKGSPLTVHTQCVFFFSLLIMNNENVQFAVTLAVKSLLKSFYKRESVSEM